jgi:ABC-type uncharacterized transport system involved in gliding motility auxiliary subunit
MNKKHTIIITALSVAAVLLVLLVSTRLWFRADLSANKSWTISPVSKKLADEIPDQVHITYFISDKLKQLAPFPGEIEDIINEYVSFSHGKISFTGRDPSKENLETRMRELGFPPQEIRTMEKDQASFINVYSGILIEYEDRADTLPFAFRLDTLEYDLTSRILGLIREKEKTIGVIIGDAEKTLEGTGQNAGYQFLQQYLGSAGYKTRAITPEELIPDNLTELFVLGGAQTLDDWMLYQIDRYIQTGGKVYFALNATNVEMSYYGVEARKIEDKGLLAMVRSYGVEVESSLVLDESALAMPLPGSNQGGGIQIIRLQAYPFYVHVLPQYGNPENPITSRFAGADLYWANPLKINAPKDIEAAPLFTSTEFAWLETDGFVIDPQQSFQFIKEKEATTGVKILAAALSGTFPRYWRDKPKPAREGSGEELPDMPPTASPSRIVVVGNANAAFDFSMGNIDFSNPRGASIAQEQPNLDFIVQTATWLGNDDDIITIRNRAPLAGRLDAVIDDEERLAAFVFARILCVFITPLIVLAAGIILASRRKKQSQLQSQSHKEKDNGI